MILKPKKNSLLFPLGVLLIILLTYISANKNSFFLILKEDIVQLVMSIDPGFSHQSFILSSDLTTAGELGGLPKKNKFLSWLGLGNKKNAPSSPYLHIGIGGREWRGYGPRVTRPGARTRVLAFAYRSCWWWCECTRGCWLVRGPRTEKGFTPSWRPSSGEERRGCSGEHRPTRW